MRCCVSTMEAEKERERERVTNLAVCSPRKGPALEPFRAEKRRKRKSLVKEDSSALKLSKEERGREREREGERE